MIEKAVENSLENVRYYSNDHIVIACMDEGSVMFRIYPNRGNWEFIQPGSIAWDSYHQDIYYSHHDFDPCPKKIVTELPPLPPVPEHKFINWADNFKYKTPPAATDFPLCAEFLNNQPEATVKIWFILAEDTYETFLGDGLFLYPANQVFLSQEEARKYVENHNPEPVKEGDSKNYYHHYSYKYCTVTREGGFITSLDCLPDRFEHFRLEDILKNLEKMLGEETHVLVN